ncbi:MAG: ATP-binding cassette domain-containing protein [Verrucomicrobiota bacterium]|nr:ATP-binding cassette domain-containing protein [Verrucomicrobiota bacterium]
MFRLENVSVAVKDHSQPTELKYLLRSISFELPLGHFSVVVGPSGCGKSTLIKTLLGIRKVREGKILLDGHDLLDNLSFFVSEIGYVPQFSVAHDGLSVLEALEYSASLRLPPNFSRQQREERILKVLGLVDLMAHAHVRVENLSGGQKRRLSLAIELLRDPQVLIFDEVTSGLDAQSEENFMRLFAQLAHEQGKTVICVTHNLDHIDLCDSVIILNAGQLVYHGSPTSLLADFEIDVPGRLYGKLNDIGAGDLPRYDFSRETSDGKQMTFTHLPAQIAQFMTLTRRQWHLFFRNPTQVTLQMILMLGFPFLVVVFALNGLPEVQSMSLAPTQNFVEEVIQRSEFMTKAIGTATLASGLIMFQVVLLTLMGSNNGAREIVRERDIFEKERLGGLSSLAYLMSKVFFVFILSALQALAMHGLVKYFCQFPGPFIDQYMILLLSTFAMSLTCLLFSALFRTTEQASLVSIYLVGLQLPLSGAVLALPEWLLLFARPLINAYWAWSGYIRTMMDSRVYDVIVENTHTALAQPLTAMAVLGGHCFICLVASYFFVKQNKSLL